MMKMNESLIQIPTKLIVSMKEDETKQHLQIGSRNSRKQRSSRPVIAISTVIGCMLLLILQNNRSATAFVVTTQQRPTSILTTPSQIGKEQQRRCLSSMNHERIQSRSTSSSSSTELYGFFFRDNNDNRKESSVKEDVTPTTVGANNNKNINTENTNTNNVLGFVQIPNLDTFQNVDVDALSAPIQSVLDEYTDGWALSYADLAPDSPQTPAGQAFLATNLFYFAVGLGLTFYVGDPFLGLLTDLAAICSYNYHYQQLQATIVNYEDIKTNSQMQNAVRISLLLDYIVASMTILTAFGYLIMSSVTGLEHGVLQSFANDITYALGISTVGVGCLLMSWKYEYGRPYMFWHSLWHLFSAYSGFLIGSAHYSLETVAATTTASPLLEVIMQAIGWSG